MTTCPAVIGCVVQFLAKSRRASQFNSIVHRETEHFNRSRSGQTNKRSLATSNLTLNKLPNNQPGNNYLGADNSLGGAAGSAAGRRGLPQLLPPPSCHHQYTRSTNSLYLTYLREEAMGTGKKPESGSAYGPFLQAFSTHSPPA